MEHARADLDSLPINPAGSMDPREPLGTFSEEMTLGKIRQEARSQVLLVLADHAC